MGERIYSLIQLCPKSPGFARQSYSGDGMFRPSILRIFGRGLDSEGFFVPRTQLMTLFCGIDRLTILMGHFFQKI